MKKIEQYKCEICGRVYDNEKDASICEVLHIPMNNLELVNMSYEYGYAFPSELELMDKTTKIRHTYYRQ